MQGRKSNKIGEHYSICLLMLPSFADRTRAMPSNSTEVQHELQLVTSSCI